MVRLGAGEVERARRGPRGDGVNPRQQLAAPVLQLLQQTLEAGVVEGFDEFVEGRCDRAVGVGKDGVGQVLAGLARQGPGAGVLQHLEARRDPGLQREAAQQGLAQGVQGLDLQPARRLQRPGEQAAGGGEGLRGDAAGVAAVEVGERLFEGGVLHQGPLAQLLEQTALHLGGRRLGVGHAQDGAGLDPGEQQARHAVDQGGGLARAGVGGDEHRQGRIGGQALGIDSERGRAHDASSARASAPTTRHSQTRASTS